MSKLDNYRRLRNLVLGCTAWVTIQLLFVGWCIVTALDGPWNIRYGSVGLRAATVTWFVTDVMIIFILAIIWVIRHD
jgi:hypothetical protein